MSWRSFRPSRPPLEQAATQTPHSLHFHGVITARVWPSGRSSNLMAPLRQLFSHRPQAKHFWVKLGRFCLIPVWVTGGIHLDGYADTCDALSSYGDREKKLEILKDPHCGAFAVIRLCSYFAAYLALCACVDFTPRVGLCWTLALVLERALSGLAVASFPMAKNTGLAHTFATAADRTTVRRVLMVLAALLSAALLALGGWALVLAALLVFARYHVVSDKQFGGITGDLAGWFLQKAELWMLAALCACQWGGLL